MPFESVLVAVALAAILVLQVVLLLRLRGGAERALRDELRLGREEQSKASRELREEVAAQLDRLGVRQAERLDALGAATSELEKSNRREIGQLAERVEARLREIRESTEKRLEQMRQTVDEKLHATLEKRLGESFQLVGTQLEAVQKGLGEMRSLAAGVGDLKRVLTNVKERGTWGEYQLGAILEQILTPDQYARNVAPRGERDERVEFAVRLPGREGQPDRPVWLPIDSKFPKEDYERLVEAAQAGDAGRVQAATEALAREVRRAAKEVGEKYLAPPATTDFAILFLPTEGLYAEVLRQPGLHDELQRKHRVLAAGPTTLSAILNSLRIGFRTLAIEKRSSEVWQVLAAVKTEFGKFGDVLDRVRKQLATASNTIDETSVRTRAVERRLRGVEELPVEDARRLLDLPPAPSGADEAAG